MHARLQLIGKQILTAAVTAFVFYYIVIYINLGTIRLFDREVVPEMGLLTIYILATFWIHGSVAQFFSTKLTTFSPWIKAFAEGGVVVALSLLLNLVLVVVPAILLRPDTPLIPLRLRLVFVVTAIAALFFYFFVERARNAKQLEAELLRAEQLQKENLRAQLESLKNQVNPHFLFNSLNVLHSLIYIDPDKAADFLSQLSEVYRALLETNADQLVLLEKEVDLAKSYLSLMKTRFGDTLQYHLDIPAAYLHLSLPPTTLQMLLENAIKHNGGTAQRPLVLHIAVENRKLLVQNNLQPRLDAIESNKIGLKNIGSRYSYFTEQEVEVEQTAQDFKVRLPLLNVEQYENSHH